MKPNQKHPHYFKSVDGFKTVDVYRVLSLFVVTDPCIQHAVKKLLVAGGRGAGKNIARDIQEAIDTLERWKEMQQENADRASVAVVIQSDSVLLQDGTIGAQTK